MQRFRVCIHSEEGGTEELAHLEMISAIVHQLTRNLSMEDIKKSGFDAYFTDHTTGVYPVAASGVPYDMKYIAVKGDVFADLNEDLAAEQKARVTYDNLLRLIDDPDVCDPIKFLREREIVHYQRFGEANPTKLNGFSAEKGHPVHFSIFPWQACTCYFHIVVYTRRNTPYPSLFSTSECKINSVVSTSSRSAH